jgi:hypothetical protein
MQLKMPLSPNATIDRALARAVVAEGLWAAAGETGLFGDVLAPLTELHLRPVAGVAAETRRISPMVLRGRRRHRAGSG